MDKIQNLKNLTKNSQKYNQKNIENLTISTKKTTSLRTIKLT